MTAPGMLRATWPTRPYGWYSVDKTAVPQYFAQVDVESFSYLYADNVFVGDVGADSFSVGSSQVLVLLDAAADSLGAGLAEIIPSVSADAGSASFGSSVGEGESGVSGGGVSVSDVWAEIVAELNADAASASFGSSVGEGESSVGGAGVSISDVWAEIVAELNADAASASFGFSVGEGESSVGGAGVSISDVWAEIVPNLTVDFESASLGSGDGDGESSAGSVGASVSDAWAEIVVNVSADAGSASFGSGVGDGESSVDGEGVSLSDVWAEIIVHVSADSASESVGSGAGSGEEDSGVDGESVSLSVAWAEIVVVVSADTSSASVSSGVGDSVIDTGGASLSSVWAEIIPQLTTDHWVLEGGTPTLSVLGTIPFTGTPQGVAVSGRRMFVSNSSAPGDIRIIDVDDSSVDTVPTGFAASRGASVNAGGDVVVVAGSGGTGVIKTFKADGSVTDVSFNDLSAGFTDLEPWDVSKSGIVTLPAAKVVRVNPPATVGWNYVHQPAYAGATSQVPLPPHQAGDLLLLNLNCYADFGINPPAAGGSVPQWTIGGRWQTSQTGVWAWARATQSGHTSGLWDTSSTWLAQTISLRGVKADGVPVGGWNGTNPARPAPSDLPAEELNRADPGVPVIVNSVPMVSSNGSSTVVTFHYLFGNSQTSWVNPPAGYRKLGEYGWTANNGFLISGGALTNEGGNGGGYTLGLSPGGQHMEVQIEVLS